MLRKSATRIGDEYNFYVTMENGSWNIANTCDANNVYFNSKENPQFVTLIVAAHTTKKPIRLVVEDGLPKVRNMCQLISVQVY